MKRTLIITLATLGAATAAAQQPDPSAHSGRLLASNCFQCHGTDGRGDGSFERLAGKSAKDIYGDLREMKAENKRGEIMTIHALGYSDAQLRAIADYFSKQPR
ncbi:MAG: c-type cytochrome [Betaproteobacteria bacterium]|nr:c-type cytochrome [Betaproteobacteria bacterium]